MSRPLTKGLDLGIERNPTPAQLKHIKKYAELKANPEKYQEFLKKKNLRRKEYEQEVVARADKKRKYEKMLNKPIEDLSLPLGDHEDLFLGDRNPFDNPLDPGYAQTSEIIEVPMDLNENSVGIDFNVPGQKKTGEEILKHTSEIGTTNYAKMKMENPEKYEKMLEAQRARYAEKRRKYPEKFVKDRTEINKNSRTKYAEMKLTDPGKYERTLKRSQVNYQKRAKTKTPRRKKSGDTMTISNLPSTQSDAQTTAIPMEQMEQTGRMPPMIPFDENSGYSEGDLEDLDISGPDGFEGGPDGFEGDLEDLDIFGPDVFEGDREENTSGKRKSRKRKGCKRSRRSKRRFNLNNYTKKLKINFRNNGSKKYR